jgi:hypothetical protein
MKPQTSAFAKGKHPRWPRILKYSFLVLVAGLSGVNVFVVALGISRFRVFAHGAGIIDSLPSAGKALLDYQPWFVALACAFCIAALALLVRRKQARILLWAVVVLAGSIAQSFFTVDSMVAGSSPLYGLRPTDLAR